MSDQDKQNSAAAAQAEADAVVSEKGPEIPSQEAFAEAAAAHAAEEAHAAANDAAAAATGAGDAERIAALEAEVSNLKDQLLRALAETENLRQRTRREREDTIKYAAMGLVKDLVEVTDNLKRAIESVPAEAIEDDSQLKNLLTGVQMTDKEILTVFERHNIKQVAALGEKLDPHSHEALFEVPDPTSPAGTVVQVMQPGYRLHDRLVRPARVGVAVGGPAAASEAAPAPGDNVDTTA
ncbi:nucleotide exchange factor GrpE [Denitrobaculum tricleocarpae]|uniref:Protein GrpE n=1 Tax=Denitrobaculum tricleocarpae TaxID=2591009 RepID=A0A545TRM6_9PROT|nr:nucleotide exchange factor GrpE [Denitrobaculum tricleocarpae]TQV79872.1 nucleotide exchange factor GrpE [Denitrobaculum tricleocarpae]